MIAIAFFYLELRFLRRGLEKGGGYLIKYKQKFQEEWHTIYMFRRTKDEDY